MSCRRKWFSLWLPFSMASRHRQILAATFAQLFEFWATVSILSNFFDFSSAFYQSDNFWHILPFQIKHRTRNLAINKIFTLYLDVSSIHECIVGNPVVYLLYMDVSLGILCLYSKYRTASCIVESIENGGSHERKRIPYSNCWRKWGRDDGTWKGFHFERTESCENMR